MGGFESFYQKELEVNFKDFKTYYNRYVKTYLKSVFNDLPFHLFRLL